MSSPAFSFTSRAVPICEVGIGSAQVPTGAALWDQARWDDPAATWAGDEPTWRDVSCFAQYADGLLGRGRLTDPFPPGTLDIVFDNRTGWADPVMSDVDGVLSIRPGRPIRLGVDHAVYGRRWLYRGFIDGVEPVFDPEEPDWVMFRCIDALGEVGRAKLAEVAATGAGEFAHERVTRILDAVPWLDSKRDIDVSAVTLVGAVLEGQVLDLLRRAGDSAGGAVFSDGDGNIVFRGRDWLYVTEGSPLDGTIGNGEPLPGYVEIPATAGNYLSAPRAAPVGDVDADWRIEYTRSPAGWPTTMRPLDDGDYKFQDIAGGAGPQVVVRVADAGFVAATGGWPVGINPGDRVQLRGTWDAATDTVSLYARPGGVDLTTDDGWILVGSTVGPAMTVWQTDSTFRISREVADFAYAGQVYRATISFDGVLVVDVNLSTDVADVDAATFTASTGQTVTVNRAGDPALELVPLAFPVCPSGWRYPFVRSDLSTRVILDRMMPPDTVTLPAPRVYDDEIGQRQYGVEPRDILDLWTEHDADMDQIGERTLALRNAATLPLVQSVSLDAATDDSVVDLLALLDIYTPSRYRCRHVLDRGVVFDDNYYATGIEFHLERDTWTAEVSLDKADLFEIPATARWDSAQWDRSLWGT